MAQQQLLTPEQEKNRLPLSVPTPGLWFADKDGDVHPVVVFVRADEDMGGDGLFFQYLPVGPGGVYEASDWDSNVGFADSRAEIEQRLEDVSG